MQILGYNIDSISPVFSLKQQTIINTINPHSYCVAKRDAKFKTALLESDILLADGIGIVLAAWLLFGEKLKRITGPDMHIKLLNEAQKGKLKVFYLGANESTLNKIKDRVNKEYPLVELASYSPPFKTEFSEEDNALIIETVNQFAPNILFIGLTAPKQEKWSYQNKHKLHVNVICSIGACFDFYAGTVKRAPKWVREIGLEWLHRSVSSPGRLGKRNILSNPEFIIDVLKFKLRIKK